MRILLVEDNAELARAIKTGLKRHWIVDAVSDCASAKTQFMSTEYFLVLLDVCLPDGTGWELCNYWRQQDSTIPLIFITGHVTMADKLRGFNLGGDDYITKPFSLAELEVRIRAQMRKSHLPSFNIYKVNNLQLDTNTQTVKTDHKSLPLRQKEWSILRLLAKRKNQIVSHYQLWEQVWEDSELVNPNTVEVHISRLRQKLRTLAADINIRTVKPLGYQLVDGRL